jgi:hypothetical protein
MLKNAENSASDDAAPDLKALNATLNAQRYGHSTAPANSRRSVEIGTASDAPADEQRDEQRTDEAPDWKKFGAEQNAARYGHAAPDGGQK